MLNQVVGFRFRPTDEEIVDYYLRLKNLGVGRDSSSSSTSDYYVDEVISTVDICSFDPWDLPSLSKKKTKDLVWYFSGLNDNRAEKQSRKTESGFWKKTGKTMEIIRKKGGNGNREKIGEKKVLVFKLLDGSKTKWVMHEYHHALFLSSNQMMTYTICKVSFNGEAKEMNPNSSGIEVDPSQSLIPQMNNNDGSEFTGVLDLDTLVKTREDFSVDEWTSYYKTYFGYDDEELMNLIDLTNDGGIERWLLW